MPTLVILLPERPRLSAAGGAAPASPLFDWLLLADNGQQLAEGQDLAAALPKSEQLVLLLPEQGLGWHRVDLPRASSKRWRAALVGLLEEQLLEDPEQMQLAIEEQAVAGEPCWVAATPKAALLEALQRIEGAQRLVDRILPRSWPTASADACAGHFFADEAGVQLRWASPDGVSSLPLRGAFARERLPASQQASWTANANALEAAELWLGAAVAVSTPAERAARALAGPWNLRQFELAPQLHGLRWLRQLGHQLMHRQWRSARRGLLLCAALGLLGLNATAWQQRKQISERQQQLEATLKTAFPRIQHVLQPSLQMRREIEALRAQAGELGNQDLEALIAALAAAWPESRGPIEALNYEGGQLGLPRAGFSDAQVEQLSSQLASEGWALQQEQGRLILRRR